MDGEIEALHEPEPILWINDSELFEISKKLAPVLSGCHFELLIATAKDNGEILEITAVAILASIPGIDEIIAGNTILELEEVGLISRSGKLLTLNMFGKTIVPDFDDWN